MKEIQCKLAVCSDTGDVEESCETCPSAIIVDDTVIRYFQETIEICNRTTTGNISHQISAIISKCLYAADKVKEQYGEIMAYHNLMHVVELASKSTTGNIAHKVATIKGLCSDSIEFIKKYGLIK